MASDIVFVSILLALIGGALFSLAMLISGLAEHHQWLWPMRVEAWLRRTSVVEIVAKHGDLKRAVLRFSVGGGAIDDDHYRSWRPLIKHHPRKWPNPPP